MLDASLRGDGDRLVDAIEHKGIPSLPNIPSDGRVESRIFATLTVQEEEVVEAGGERSSVVRGEDLPDFPGAGASEQQVVNIFVEGAGGAGSRSSEHMPEPSLIGGEPTALCKPIEDLTLQRCITPPNHSRKLVRMQVPESKGVEVFV
jgi:hypothetical protein